MFILTLFTLTCEHTDQIICGTGVLSLLFDYRVGQGVPLPAL